MQKPAEPTLNNQEHIANTRINIDDLWRERVEVESTTRSAKERVAGFEGREGHRTPFAPVVRIPSQQSIDCAERDLMVTGREKVRGRIARLFLGAGLRSDARNRDAILIRSGNARAVG